MFDCSPLVCFQAYVVCIQWLCFYSLLTYYETLCVLGRITHCILSVHPFHAYLQLENAKLWKA